MTTTLTFHGRRRTKRNILLLSLYAFVLRTEFILFVTLQSQVYLKCGVPYRPQKLKQRDYRTPITTTFLAPFPNTVEHTFSQRTPPTTRMICMYLYPN